MSISGKTDETVNYNGLRLYRFTFDGRKRVGGAAGTQLSNLNSYEVSGNKAT